MTPGSKLVAVNGRKYSKDILKEALGAGGAEMRVISLLVEKDEIYKTLDAPNNNRATMDCPGLRWRTLKVPDACESASVFRRN